MAPPLHKPPCFASSPLASLNATLSASMMFFPVLHCSCSCFTTTPPHVLLRCSSLCFVAPYVLLFLLFCYSSYFIVVHRVSLLLLVLRYYSSYFIVVHCDSLLLLVLCYYSSCFTAPTTLLLCGALLLYCPPRYLFPPCCFVVLPCFATTQCFATPLLGLVFPPLPNLFFSNVEIWNSLGRNLRTSKLLVNFFFFFMFFLKTIFVCPSLIIF